MLYLRRNTIPLPAIRKRLHQTLMKKVMATATAMTVVPPTKEPIRLFRPGEGAPSAALWISPSAGRLLM